MAIIDFNASAWGIPAGGFPGIPAKNPIRNEAVEIAARTWFERSTGLSWDEEPEQSRRGHRGDARAALAAAVPIMLANAWDRALQDADDQGYLYEHQTELLKQRNPYRA